MRVPHTHTHTHSLSLSHTHTHTQAHTHTHKIYNYVSILYIKFIILHIYAYIHTYILTYIQIHTYTQIHTYIQIQGNIRRAHEEELARVRRASEEQWDALDRQVITRALKIILCGAYVLLEPY